MNALSISNPPVLNAFHAPAAVLYVTYTISFSFAYRRYTHVPSHHSPTGSSRSFPGFSVFGDAVLVRYDFVTPLLSFLGELYKRNCYCFTANFARGVGIEVGRLHRLRVRGRSGRFRAL